MPFAHVKDVRLWYEVHGPEDGEPLVFASGTGVHGRIWKAQQIPYFVARGYRCLIFDYRGTGESDKPALKYSTRMFADDLAALMDVVGMRDAHLIGHSMGGRVCQWVALDHPRKVRSLVLLATGPGKTHKFKEHPLGVPLADAIELGTKGFDEFLQDLFGGAFFATPEVAARPDFAEAVRVRTSYPPPVAAYLRHVVARQEHYTADRLYELGMPALIVCGDADTQPSGTGNHLQEARELHRLIAGSDFVTIPGARHGFIHSHAEQTNDTIDRWLEQRGKAGPFHAKAECVIHIDDWSALPDRHTPVGLLIDESKADVMLADGRRYRQDWPGANFDGIGQRYAHVTGARIDADPDAVPRVFVNVDDRDDVYCLGTGSLSRSEIDARWHEAQRGE